MTRYHSNFPALPTALVSAISAIAGIPTIVEAKACRDGGIILEIYHDDNYNPSVAELTAAADVVGCDIEDVFIEASNETTLTVSFLTSENDFGYLFPVAAEYVSPAVVTEAPPSYPELSPPNGPDSEEMIEILEDLFNFRNRT